MRVISKFHDFYDTACAWDREEYPLFIRDTKEIEITNDKDPDQAAALKAVEPISKVLKAVPSFSAGSKGIIAFCGKLYPFYICPGHLFATTFNKRVFYDPSSLVEALKEEESTLGYKKHGSQIKELESEKTRRFSNPLNRGTWKKFREEYPNPCVSDEPFRYFKSPIIIVWAGSYYSVRHKIIVNPLLKEYNFQTQVDPYTAYQEIDMFLSNNLSDQQDPPAEISDDLKRHAHGFDKEYGFRKRPGEDMTGFRKPAKKTEKKIDKYKDKAQALDALVEKISEKDWVKLMRNVPEGHKETLEKLWKEKRVNKVRQ